MSEVKSKSKLSEITEQLEQGIIDLFASDRYTEYLNTMAKFHNYSFCNTVLIAMQRPSSTLVAGYHAWQTKFKRQVKKGEKGMMIFAPTPYKTKMSKRKIDPLTKCTVTDANGQPVMEEIEVQRMSFRVVSVFDVEQTEGEELSTIVTDLQGSTEDFPAFMEALREASPVPITVGPIRSAAKGYYSHDGYIIVREGMSDIQTIKTTIHEISHALLHAIDAEHQSEPSVSGKDRRTKEVESESIAYTVCKHYGLDTSDYSFGYIAGWSRDKELAELKASLELIRATAAHLITLIDIHLGTRSPGIIDGEIRNLTGT